MMDPNPSNCSAAIAPMPQVEGESSNLSNAIGRLEVMVADLVKKCSPVMIGSCEQLTCPKETKDQVLCPVATTLRSYSQRVNAMNNTVNAMLNNLQI